MEEVREAGENLWCRRELSELIGAIGVSGDGIEQDDIVSAAGARDFLPPSGSRSDDMVYERARIPYAKFPRAATSF